MREIQKKIERLSQYGDDVRKIERINNHIKWCGYTENIINTEKDQMGKARNQCICRMFDLINKIESMKDESEKDLLTYRYINGLKWQEIANKMGYSLQHIHRIHKKAVCNFKM